MDTVTKGKRVVVSGLLGGGYQGTLTHTGDYWTVTTDNGEERSFDPAAATVRLAPGEIGHVTHSLLCDDRTCVDCGGIHRVYTVPGSEYRCIDCNSGPKPCKDCGVLVSDQPGLHKCAAVSR